MHGAIIQIIFLPYKLAYAVKSGLGCKLKLKTGIFLCMDMMAQDQRHPSFLCHPYILSFLIRRILFTCLLPFFYMHM